MKSVVCEGAGKKKKKNEERNDPTDLKRKTLQNLQNVRYTAVGKLNDSHFLSTFSSAKSRANITERRGKKVSRCVISDVSKGVEKAWVLPTL